VQAALLALPAVLALLVQALPALVLVVLPFCVYPRKELNQNLLA
jgi:hypothetical protein